LQQVDLEIITKGDDFNQAFRALARHLGERRDALQRKQRRQNMIDHIILTVSDFERSVAFYAKALKPLGITNFTDYEGQDGHPDLKGFGDGKRAFFWLKEGKPDPQAVHVGFVAKDHAEVDAFYKAAVDAGGKSKEAPQARPEYYPGYYATWVLDPDGHDIEVVHKS
jgi:catechol 2,3-dioxygenase-like lactoylglutathione lyase family enzyme